MNNFFRKLRYVLPLCTLLGSAHLWAQEEVESGEPLNKKLKPGASSVDEELFRDMVVVQRKAMNKGGRFLISSYGSVDFSDGPYTQYSWNINPGYAINDFWEVYLSAAPVFFSQKRDIVKEVKDKTGYDITASRPRYSYGAEVLWSPLYGKDSLGSRHIVRSDTFIKFGVHNIQYDHGNGLKFHAGLGKTYFLSKNLGLRPVVSGNYIQTIVDQKKEFRFFAIVELGLVAYF